MYTEEQSTATFLMYCESGLLCEQETQEQLQSECWSGTGSVLLWVAVCLVSKRARLRTVFDYHAA